MFHFTISILIINYKIDGFTTAENWNKDWFCYLQPCILLATSSFSYTAFIFSNLPDTLPMLLLILDEKSDSAEKNTDPGKDLTDEEKDLTDEQEKNLIAHVKEIDLDADREEKDRRHANIYIAGSGPA